MDRILGEIRLLAYDDIPAGWMKCEGQTLEMNKYLRLYMMIGVKFGQDGVFTFKIPDLKKEAPPGLVYCIAVEGDLPKIQGGVEDSDGIPG